MNLCNYFDRLEEEDGQLVRIVNAKARAKRCEGKSLDVYKEYENGKEVCRNLYTSMSGYRVAFPNEKTSLYRNGNCSFIQDLDEYGECKIPAFFWWSRSPNEKELKLIIKHYPDFKYVLEKWSGTISKTMAVLRIWKEHKEIEFLLAGGYEKLAMNKAFWRLSLKKRKEVVQYVRKNDKAKTYKLTDILTIIKFKLTDEEFRLYDEFCSLIGRCAYDVYKYLTKTDRDDYNNLWLYKDYHKLLLQTAHNKSDPYWRFPKDLRQKHDEVREEVNRILEARKNETPVIKQEKYFNAVKKLLKYKTEIDGYCVYVPETIEEIKAQADALHQCLITADYVQQVINRRCVLVFIQKKGKPIATAQLMRGDKIGQFYADEYDRNNCLPSDEVRKVMDKWIAYKEVA